MDKIPVKVVWVKDINGKNHSSVMLAMEDIIGEIPSTDFASVKKFNSQYIDLISNCKNLLKKGKIKNKIRPSTYWQVGKNLLTFVETNELHYKFKNYRVAFQRDLVLTDSYVGVIMDFPKFFKEEEVSDSIPMSYYFELILKARALDEKHILKIEKEKLKELSDTRKLPDHKTYRKILKERLDA